MPITIAVNIELWVIGLPSLINHMALSVITHAQISQDRSLLSSAEQEMISCILDIKQLGDTNILHSLYVLLAKSFAKDDGKRLETDLTTITINRSDF